MKKMFNILINVLASLFLAVITAYVLPAVCAKYHWYIDVRLLSVIISIIGEIIMSVIKY